MHLSKISLRILNNRRNNDSLILGTLTSAPQRITTYPCCFQLAWLNPCRQSKLVTSLPPHTGNQRKIEKENHLILSQKPIYSIVNINKQNCIPKPLIRRKRNMNLFKLAPLLLLALLAAIAKADFGDTVDPTFNCPALTTCAQVCVATVEDCPLEMACPNENESLCADGSCAVFCDPTLETPCTHECAPVACNRIDDTYDQCQEKYGNLYDNATACGEEEDAYEISLVEFNEPAYIFGYVWVSGVTFLILAWCAYK